jgi:glutamyl-Q tRNA(Asp) synthetase
MAPDTSSDKRAARPVFRFAPSPNGLLHLGHALSALVNFQIAQKLGGRFLLRMEDIDTVRCSEAFEDAIYEDLRWLGIEWESPVRRQSEHFDTYREALDALYGEGLIYPATLSRSALKRTIAEAEARGETWPRDPDGAPLYPLAERNRSSREQRQIIESGEPFAWRLNMKRAQAAIGKADISWIEFHARDNAGDNSDEEIRTDPAAWGDVILARKDTPTSYHLSVVVDDHLQDITHIVRGKDLAQATSVHRLLQSLLGYQVPVYHHHDLVLGDDGQKLSKSRDDTSLASLRAGGMTPADIRRMIGLKTY